MGQITITAHANAPMQAVWDVLVDNDGWAEWGDFTNSVRVVDGIDEPNGVGAVRELWTAAILKVHERVEVFDPESGVYEYVLLSGLPLKDYRGRVEMADDGTGTSIRWSASWTNPIPIPGTDILNTQLMRIVIGRLAGGLCAAAARRTAVS